MLKAQTITPNANHTAVEVLKGFSIREDSAAAAQVTLRIASVGGQVIWELDLAATTSASIVFPKGAWIGADGGVYVEEVSGSVEGVLFY